MDTLHTATLLLGSAWASGINLYAAVFMLGLLASTGNIELPADLALLSDPLVMGTAGTLYLVEFFADKVPGIDSLWDAGHTFIRIPAGALLAAGAVGELGPGAQLAGALLGGTVAASTHFSKAGTRAMINTSPEPVSNWTASVGEDIAVIGGLWAALHHPMLFLFLLTGFVLLIAWLLPRLWRGIRHLAGHASKFFSSGNHS